METRKRKYSNFYVICMVGLVLLAVCSAYIVAANQPPVADADPDYQTVYAGEEAWFTGKGSYDSDGYIVSYYWDFGVGMYLTGETVSFVFNALGNFSVTLIVTDDAGDTATDTVWVNVVEEPPQPDEPVAWIESLTTDKQVYDINETVNTTVIVRRGTDVLTYVWEGTLALEVFDDAMVIVYDDDRGVFLPSGGTTQTFYFEFILTEPGDYLVRATLYDMNNIQVDIEETCITVGEEPPGGILFVWIDSLTTDKQVYNINELVSTTVIVKRGNDMLTWVWEGTLILKVYDDAMVLVSTEDQGVYLPCGGTTETHYFEFVLTEPGDYLVRAILYDMDNIQADLEEICITVSGEPSGGNGTKPPNWNGTNPPDGNGTTPPDGNGTGPNNGIVWIESLTTDKQMYNINELVSITVVVKRGNDLLTYVWEGTLILEIFDDALVLVYSEDQGVYLPCGGMTETHNFEYTVTESGDYLVRATLYDMDDILVDVKEICITVSEEPGDGLGIDLSGGSETGLFEGNGGWLIALAIMGTTAVALLGFATICGSIKIWGRKR